MAEDQKLRTRIEAIRPINLTETALKPGTVYVAILRPDVSPQDSDIDSADVFWAKCPLSKTVDTLLKALARDVKQTVKLFQGRCMLNQDLSVSSLTTKDNLCVIVAVYEDEVDDYLQSLPLHNAGPSPMRDITKNAVNRPLKSQSSGSKPPSSSKNTLTTKARKRKSSSSRRESFISSPSPSETTVPIPGTLFAAWFDFVYNRREYHRQPTGSPWPSMCETDYTIIDEWHQDVTPQQRNMLIERTSKFTFDSLKEQQAFWQFFHKQQDGHPLEDIVGDSNLFESRYNDWNSKSRRGERYTHINLVENQRSALDVPILLNGVGSPFSPKPEVISEGSPEDVESERDQSDPFGSLPGWFHDESGGQNHSDLRGKKSVDTKLNVSELFDDRSVEQLEAGVAAGAEILTSIKSKLTAAPSDESEHWLVALNNLEKQLVRTKTVVGVVGATGAGKSSVINAILDQERLVPTNCMRACTAVVTEISYNYEEIQFRAEIDFIGKEDWLKELNTSFQDLFDGSGKVSRECANEDSEAGIAYAKMKAVYPLMTKDQMENTTIEALLDHKNVKDLLGGSHQLEDEEAPSFYKKLQRYVDSKEKSSREKKGEIEKAKARQMEFWPLIRVVRLYVKAPALATGAVIVDLPGVHDSNQARAAVAQGYLKQCTGLWIVAPINRAVDDKSAKTLLGDTFKRQLKMDGGYSSVTFVCSKTDDISITEAQDSLGLDEEMMPLFARYDELDKKVKEFKRELEQMKDRKSDITDAMDSADEELETWEKLGADLAEGKTVHAPKTKQADEKRKRGTSSENSRKRPKYAEVDSDDDFIAEGDSDDSRAGFGDESDDASDEIAREPLTEANINEKISELKESKKAGRRERTALEDSIRDVRSKVGEVQKEQDEIDDELRDKCIRGRNEYSRGAIQQDFASGIRELDQEIAEEEDAANFNPEVEVRDYDLVAKSLPVFCVSSRGYQKAMGRLVKDKGATSFRNVEDTGIPALQEHCKKLTVTNREVSCKRFLNDFSQLLNSLRLWSSSDGTTTNLTDEQKSKEAEFLGSKLRKLDNTIENAVSNICKKVQQEFDDNLYDKFPSAVNASINEANEIQARWGAPINRENRLLGGLYWSTYKATVRRDGIWSSNNFNHDLIEPTIKNVTPGWEKVFSRRLPQIFSSFSNDIYEILAAYHNEIETRALSNELNVATFQMLRQQLTTYREVAKDAGNIAKDFITTRQKDVNREFVPKVTEAMLPAYANTTAEVGPGQYQRMKNAMRMHVDYVRNHMFSQSTAHVQGLLKDMLKNLKDLMLSKLDVIFIAIKRDYESVVIGKTHQPKQSEHLSMQQRRIRADVQEIIEGVELIMKRVIELEPQEKSEELSLQEEEQQSSVMNTMHPPNRTEGLLEANKASDNQTSLQDDEQATSIDQIDLEQANQSPTNAPKYEEPPEIDANLDIPNEDPTLKLEE